MPVHGSSRAQPGPLPEAGAQISGKQKKHQASRVSARVQGRRGAPAAPPRAAERGETFILCLGCR